MIQRYNIEEQPYADCSDMEKSSEGIWIKWDERIEHALRICEGVSLRDLRNAKTGLMKLLCDNFEDVRDIMDAKS